MAASYHDATLNDLELAHHFPGRRSNSAWCASIESLIKAHLLEKIRA